MNKIKFYRTKKGYTQERIARQLNISLRHFQNIEKGISIPSITIALNISKILETDVYILFKEHF